MQFRAKHSEVTAFEVAPVVDGKPTDERRFVVDGVGVFDRETFTSLYAPAEIKAPEPIKPQAFTKRATKKKAATAVERQAKTRKTPGKLAIEASATTTTPAAAPVRATITEAIRTTLTSGPQSSEELLKTLLTKGYDTDDKRLYASLYDMRNRNQIYKGEFPDVKWYPAKKVNVAGAGA
jgi:hypothetical protein